MISRGYITNTKYVFEHFKWSFSIKFINTLYCIQVKNVLSSVLYIQETEPLFNGGKRKRSDKYHIICIALRPLLDMKSQPIYKNMSSKGTTARFYFNAPQNKMLLLILKKTFVKYDSQCKLKQSYLLMGKQNRDWLEGNRLLGFSLGGDPRVPAGILWEALFPDKVTTSWMHKTQNRIWLGSGESLGANTMATSRKHHQFFL